MSPSTKAGGRLCKPIEGTPLGYGIGAQMENPHQQHGDRRSKGGGEQSCPSKENVLMHNIDYAISNAAASMQGEGGMVEQSLGPVEDARPMDSNLVCPICGRQFRIGQIQHYRYHVDNCA